MSYPALRKLLEHSPAAWALVRAAEVDVLSGVPFKHPILDVGCGDGFFTKVLLEEKGEKYFDWGLDLSRSEVERARKSKTYKDVIVAGVAKMPFDDARFATVFSNGTLEHIKEIDKALAEISRVLKPGGRLVFTVPSKYLTSYLFFSNFFPFYGYLFNKIFAHYNLFDHNQWERLLRKEGLKIIGYEYYNPKGQIYLHDILTWLALPSLVNKKLFGRWILFPAFRQFTANIEFKLLKRLYTNQTSKKEGGSMLIVAQKNES